MLNRKHLNLLRRGVDEWNLWREENRRVVPNLRGANLAEAELSGANLRRAILGEANLAGARLSGANLPGANLIEADLTGADLSGANLHKAMLADANLSKAKASGADLTDAHIGDATLDHADFSGTDLTGAYLGKPSLYETNFTGANLSAVSFSEAVLFSTDFTEANLRGTDFTGEFRSSVLDHVNLTGADLTGADLLRVILWRTNLTRADLTEAQLSQANVFGCDFNGADLTRANLIGTSFIDTSLEGSILVGCRVYGTSAWDLKLSDSTQQSNLLIEGADDAIITVDDIEVAQFVYLLLNNQKLRDVIDTMTSKAVLILGNFAPEPKLVLDAIKERLRERGYLPIMFDFPGPQNQRFIDTVTTVARLSRFVIADLTQPRSVTGELTAIVEQLPLLPIQPLILKSEDPSHAFITDVVVSDSVLKLHRYANLQDLLASFDESILAPALKSRDELEERRLRAIKEKL